LRDRRCETATERRCYSTEFAAIIYGNAGLAIN
jgi:hypothetical protein